MWHVYILECADGTLYTGSTNDLERRVAQHKRGEGAKYTKSRGIRRLVYSERKRTRSTAQRREAEIKGFTRAQKMSLIQ